MAIRTDIFSVNWDLSPRIINIAEGFLEVNVQDMYDTLRHLEASPGGIDEAPICDAGGWEPLGGGSYVGITVSLFNAKYKFCDCAGPDWTIANMTGGNIVAFTDRSATVEMYPREPSTFISADRSAASSATTTELDGIIDILKLTGNKVVKVGDIITIYEDDETTPWRSYDLDSGGRVEL